MQDLFDDAESYYSESSPPKGKSIALPPTIARMLDGKSDPVSLLEQVQELVEQYRRRCVNERTGLLREEISSREVKEVITASSQLAQLLVRHKDALDGMKLAREFDLAVVQVLQRMDKDHQTRYLQLLEEELAVSH